MFWKRKRIQIEGKKHTPLSTPLEELSFTVFDTETTGFDVHTKDRIIEIGAVHITGLEVTNHTFQTYVNPHRSIPAEIVELTGIDDKDVIDAPNAIEGIQLFFQFFAQHSSSCWVGHNLSFDLLALKKELQRSRFCFKRPSSIDTINLIQLLKPTWEVKELDEYSKHFNTPIFHRHTALGDALTTAHLFCALLQCVHERGCHTWGDLMYSIESQQRMMALH
jgi:DNA polymerase-3 subunit epsilon